MGKQKTQNVMEYHRKSILLICCGSQGNEKYGFGKILFWKELERMVCCGIFILFIDSIFIHLFIKHKILEKWTHHTKHSLKPLLFFRLCNCNCDSVRLNNFIFLFCVCNFEICFSFRQN